MLELIGLIVVIIFVVRVLKYLADKYDVLGIDKVEKNEEEIVFDSDWLKENKE